VLPEIAYNAIVGFGKKSIIKNKKIRIFMSLLNMNYGINDEDRFKIIALCKAVLPNCSIRLYGSRDRGDFRSNSDIDIALDCKSSIDIMKLF
jgi:predicted nucleotidyltransferase